MGKVYICGQVSGLDYFEACELFNKREKELRKLGFDVCNPVKVVPPDAKWNEAMKICIAELLKCTSISPIFNTLFSEGALLEWHIARKLNYPIVLP